MRYPAHTGKWPQPHKLVKGVLASEQTPTSVAPQPGMAGAPWSPPTEAVVAQVSPVEVIIKPEPQHVPAPVPAPVHTPVHTPSESPRAKYEKDEKAEKPEKTAVAKHKPVREPVEAKVDGKRPGVLHALVSKHSHPHKKN